MTEQTTQPAQPRIPLPAAPPAVFSFSALLRSHLPALAKRYKVKSLSLFGSYVRNEQRANSDLDVLVEFDEAPSLFEFVRLVSWSLNSATN